jgi:hypothetical protein
MRVTIQAVLISICTYHSSGDALFVGIHSPIAGLDAGFVGARLSMDAQPDCRASVPILSHLQQLFHWRGAEIRGRSWNG